MVEKIQIEVTPAEAKGIANILTMDVETTYSTVLGEKVNEQYKEQTE